MLVCVGMHVCTFVCVWFHLALCIPVCVCVYVCLAALLLSAYKSPAVELPFIVTTTPQIGNASRPASERVR